jgi:predicted amidohydrolase YtcJ
VTLHLTNARIPGERGLLGNLINISIDNGVVSALDFIGQTTSVTLPSATRAARVVQGDDQVIDLDGRWIMPGLWDSHVHMGQWAQARRRLVLSHTTSVDAVLERVSQRVDSADSALVGFGWRPAEISGQTSLDSLDAVTGDKPTYLFSVDMHSVWLNSTGFAAQGVTATESGVVSERACFEIAKSVSSIDDETLDAWIDEAAREAARRGVVGITDFEMAPNSAAWRRRISGGADTLRVEAAIYPEFLETAVEAGMRTGDTVASTGGLLRVGPLKIILDGSLGSQTARCFEPYPGATGPAARGVLNLPLPELVSLMGRAWAAGIAPAVHAIGDEAVDMALDAFEMVQCAGTIEHAQLVRVEDVPRFSQLKVLASVQPRHLVDDRTAAERLWPGRTGQAFAFRQMRDAGVAMRFGSDAPAAALDPWQAIVAAVTRTAPGGEAWNPQECLSVDEAIQCSVRSHVAVGQPADFAVLDIDPLEVDDLSSLPLDLATTPVSATFVGGRVTHSLLEKGSP